jgi:uncharacterized membrane protein YvbJ
MQNVADLPFACSRCGHRQAADERCQRCDNELVQDLRASRTHHYLRDVETRWRARRHARFLAIAAAAGVVVNVLVLVLFTSHRTSSARLLISGFVVAILVDGALEATIGRRRLFPYLDDVEREVAATRSVGR